MKSASQIFENDLKARGIPFELTQEGTYEIKIGEESIVVSLENVEKDYLRDNDPRIVHDFVMSILSYPIILPDSFNQARDNIFFLLEPSDFDLGNAYFETVTPSVIQALVYYDPKTHMICFLTPSDIDKWQITKDEVYKVAVNNMSLLANDMIFTTDKISSSTYVYIEGNSIFKASIILSPNIKEKIPSELGWPVLVVIPARDFLIFFPEGDNNLLQNIGKVVIDEYTQSGYPLTTEVLRISDGGIEAIGAFQLANPK